MLLDAFGHQSRTERSKRVTEIKPVKNYRQILKFITNFQVLLLHGMNLVFKVRTSSRNC